MSEAKSATSPGVENIEKPTAQPVKEVKKDFDPFAGPVNDKSYTNPTNVFSQQDLINEIPEPSMAPPPLTSKAYRDPFLDEIEKERDDEIKKQNKQQQAQQKIPEPAFNPALNDLPDDEKEEAAKHMVQAIRAGYELVNHHANNFLKISERRIYKMVQKGELDLNAKVIYDLNKRMPVTDFLKQYNEQVDGTFYVSEDFWSKVDPILTRVIKKRGAGLSDEQLLLVLFGKDIWVKFNMGWNIKATLNQILAFAKQDNAKNSASAAAQPQAPVTPPPPQPTQPPPTPPPSQPQEPVSEVYTPIPGSPLATQAKYLDTNMPVGMNAIPVVPVKAPIATDGETEDDIVEIENTGRRRYRKRAEGGQGENLEELLVQTRREPKTRGRKKGSGKKVKSLNPV